MLFFAPHEYNLQIFIGEKIFAPHEYNLQIFIGEKIILKEVAEINKSKYGIHTH